MGNSTEAYWYAYALILVVGVPLLIAAVRAAG